MQRRAVRPGKVLCHMKNIVVLGSLNADYVLEVQHMPAVGETVLSDGLAVVPGGKGANQAFALGRMGAQVTMLGMVGLDGNGELELENLRRAGVDVSRVARGTKPTGLAVVTINAQGDNSIIAAQGANLEVDKDYIDANRDVLQKADLLLMQLEIPLETVLYAAQTAKQLGKTVILDPAPVPEALPDELLRCVDYLKPNELELAALTGAPDVLEDLHGACGALRQRGAGTVLASLGSKGAYVLSDAIPGELFPGQPVEVVDTTAAGDSFTAAVAYALSRQVDLRQAVLFANRVAAVVVTRKGAQTSIPTQSEIEALWNSRAGGVQ